MTDPKIDNRAASLRLEDLEKQIDFMIVKLGIQKSDTRTEEISVFKLLAELEFTRLECEGLRMFISDQTSRTEQISRNFRLCLKGLRDCQAENRSLMTQLAKSESDAQNLEISLMKTKEDMYVLASHRSAILQNLEISSVYHTRLPNRRVPERRIASTQTSPDDVCDCVGNLRIACTCRSDISRLCGLVARILDFNDAVLNESGNLSRKFQAYQSLFDRLLQLVPAPIESFSWHFHVSPAQ